MVRVGHGAKPDGAQVASPSVRQCGTLTLQRGRRQHKSLPTNQVQWEGAVRPVNTRCLHFLCPVDKVLVIKPVSDNPAWSGLNDQATKVCFLLTGKTIRKLFKLLSITATVPFQYTSALQTFMPFLLNCWHISQFPTGNHEESRTKHTPAKFKFNESC